MIIKCCICGKKEVYARDGVTRKGYCLHCWGLDN